MTMIDLEVYSKINIVFWVCYNLKVININTYNFNQNQNNYNQNFIKSIVRNLYALT